MITEAIDFRYLLIENYKKLKINENELATIFVIDHLIGQGNPFVTSDLLSLKMSLDVKDIDKTNLIGNLRNVLVPWADLLFPDLWRDSVTVATLT